MRHDSAHDLRLLLAVTAAALILIVGGLATIGAASRGLLRADAEATARAWAEDAAARIDELPAILARQEPTPATRAILEQIRQIGAVFRFKLFDANGELVLVSDALSTRDSGTSLIAERARSDLAASILGGTAFVEAKTGTPPDRPEYFSEAYLPIARDGRTIGVVEVYVDQSAKAKLVRRSFQVVAAVISSLLLVAMGLPAAALYWKLRERRAMEARVHFLAHHDALTGLPNRESFQTALEAALARTRRDGTHVAVLCLDLDRFKEVNDALGHAAGDGLLRDVANRLRAEIREIDTVARLSGDEFAIVQVGIGQPEEAGRLARRLCQVLACGRDIAGHEIVCTASIGVALSGIDADDPAALLKAADLALYRAKSDGRNTVRFFEAEMDAKLQARRALERDMRAAFAAEAFELHYQPQFDLATGRLLGYEALLRWRHSKRGDVPPGEFIPLAEETGLIVPLGAWILRRACRDALAWPVDLKVAVNLSPMQFRLGDLEATIVEALRGSGLAPGRLELEITEGLLLRDTELVMAKLAALKKLGIRVAMDDFGTGYSSLSYLWRFPFDKLKIDRSFVQNLDSNDNVPAILRTIIALGRTLNVTVTAEGIETETQADSLRGFGCDEVQGYLFGRPIPAAATAREGAWETGCDIAAAGRGVDASDGRRDAAIETVSSL